MDFKKNDENYIYNVIGKNVKKYRKQKHLTQAELADKINYSLSFISSLESKKYQSFSLGALYRISLILEIDMYKLCIDEEEKETPKYIKYKCDICNYETEIPYEALKIIKEANNLYDNNTIKELTFKCKKCNGKLHQTKILNQQKKDNLEPV